jgi:hypothetical protein
LFNATFSNISAISWRPVLVVNEAGVPSLFSTFTVRFNASRHVFTITSWKKTIYSLKVCQLNCTRWYIVLIAWLFYCMNIRLLPNFDTHRWPDMNVIEVWIYKPNSSYKAQEHKFNLARYRHMKRVMFLVHRYAFVL